MVYILSFDIGIKNFAYSCLEIINIENIVLTPIDDFFKNNQYKVIDIKNINLYNIKTDKKFNLYDRVVVLLLTMVEQLDQNIPIKILVEYQLNINYKSNIIYNIILTFFETFYKINKRTNYEIITVKPSYKIKLAETIDKDGTIRIKFINQYKYNKEIVSVYFLKLNDKYNFIKLNNNKKIDDIADSFIQILAYISLNNI